MVALAGSTGSGKSSLFNALAGERALAGRRPPADDVDGARLRLGLGGRGAAARLARRAAAADPGVTGRARCDGDDEVGELDGLVLLDLPDHDSTVVEHRLEVDRLVELVDLLVWVVDPQKYADQALHERYLRRLAGHAAVIVVVLNQVDTVNPFAAAECAEDLRRLLDEDGLRRSPVLTTSARTGAGLDGLRALLADAVLVAGGRATTGWSPTSRRSSRR